MSYRQPRPYRCSVVPETIEMPLDKRRTKQDENLDENMDENMDESSVRDLKSRVRAAKQAEKCR